MSIEDSFKYFYNYLQDKSYQKHLNEKYPKMSVSNDTMEWWQKAAAANIDINPKDVTDKNLLDQSTKRVFDSGSQRDNDTDKPLPNHLDAYVRLRYGYLLRMGANNYDKGNWKKGQPTEAALESLHRHLAKFEINLDNKVDQDEDHLSAIIFNIMLIMKNEEKDGIPVDKYYKTKK
jgi:hypothetical protein